MAPASREADRGLLHWDPAAARVDGFSTATARKGVTLVTVKMAVTNPWELGDLMRQLAELRDGRIAPGKPSDV